MGEREERQSGNSTAIIVVVVMLLLGLPCLVVVFLFGTGALFWLGARDMPAPAPPPMVQPGEPQVDVVPGAQVPGAEAPLQLDP